MRTKRTRKLINVVFSFTFCFKNDKLERNSLEFRVFIMGIIKTIAVFLLLAPFLASAGVFPNNAMSEHFEWTENTPVGGVVLLATSTRTVLGVNYQTSDNSTRSFLYCGSEQEANEIYEAHNSIQVDNALVHFLCDKAITYKAQGLVGDSHFILTWVDYDLALVEEYATTTPLINILVASSTSPSITSSGFTYGEIVIGFFLFLLVVMTFFGGLLNRIVGVKKLRPLYNKYIGGGHTYEGKIEDYDS